MRLDAPQPRPPVESVTPMINVVFLLLIFFLMTATIAPPAPFEVELPAAEAEPGAAETPRTLHLRADGAIEAAALARVLTRLGERGVARADIVVSGR